MSYVALEIDPKATSQQVRDAYKKAALKHHPDRVPTTSPERAQRTRRFQLINDAYYVLSDAGRRREYDGARAYHGAGRGSGRRADAADDPAEDEIPRPQPQPSSSSSSAPSGSAGSAGYMPGGFPWSAFGFGGADGGAKQGSASDRERAHDKFSSDQFGNVFEEMLRDEGMAEGENASPTHKFWSFVGALSGGAMGFIIANFPGAVAGAVAGNRIGAIRDARGKSVYSVFQELPQVDKAKMLTDLAAKVFSHAVSG